MPSMMTSLKKIVACPNRIKIGERRGARFSRIFALYERLGFLAIDLTQLFRQELKVVRGGGRPEAIGKAVVRDSCHGFYCSLSGCPSIDDPVEDSTPSANELLPQLMCVIHDLIIQT